MKPLRIATVCVGTGLLVQASLACPFCTRQTTGLFIGETQLLGNGSIRSWVFLDDNAKPTSVGITFTDTALTGLPENKPVNGMDGYEFVLKLPKEAAATALKHVSVDWNPKGHIPPGVYDVPHFDVHFYMATTKERMKMTLDEASLKKFQKKPPAKLLPGGYIYALQGEVKYMGAHWVDVASPEFKGSPFTHTFIYGTYDAKVIFIEPMVTKSFLETKAAVDAPIKQPETYQFAGKYFPTKYTVHYNPQRHEYTIALESFVRR
ncbi:MAG: DUF5602 domain-containing protein [Fimbriimonadales bacterium]